MEIKSHVKKERKKEGKKKDN